MEEERDRPMKVSYIKDPEKPATKEKHWNAIILMDQLKTGRTLPAEYN